MPDELTGSIAGIEVTVDTIYARGSVHDDDGNTVDLRPHSVERAQGEALRDLAIAEGAERTIEVAWRWVCRRCSCARRCCPEVGITWRSTRSRRSRGTAPVSGPCGRPA